MNKGLKRFEFSINVSCTCSRHIAKKMQEFFFDSFEEIAMEDQIQRWQMSYKLLGWSANITPVKEVKE